MFVLLSWIAGCVQDCGLSMYVVVNTDNSEVSKTACSEASAGTHMHVCMLLSPSQPSTV